jgi:hypothetical protein
LKGGVVGSSTHRVVLYHCEDCKTTVRRGGERDVRVSQEALERVLCNAEVLDTREGPGRLSRTAPPSIARYVAARAGGGCQVPGCFNRAYLETHHEGGWRTTGHDPERMLILCSGHHAARHEGQLLIEGTSSEGFRFYLADGTLLGQVAPREGGGVDRLRSDDAASPVPPAAPEGGSTRSRAGTRSRERSGSARRQPRKRVRSREQEDALRALRQLAFGKREASRFLKQALAERPELEDGSAEELVKAVLILSSRPGSSTPSVAEAA